jgi:hypothetical protein
LKKTLQCPKCDSRKLWHVEKLLERGGQPLAYADTTDLAPSAEIGVHFIDNEPRGDLR